MAKPEPGRDPKMAERTNRLNVVFLLSSLGLLLIFVPHDLGRLRPRVEEVPDRVQQARGEAQTQEQRDAARAKVDAHQAQGARGPDRPGRERGRGTRAARCAKARAEARQGSTASGTASTRTSASPRPRSTWPATTTKRPPTRAAGAPRRPRRPHLDDLEKQWADYRIDREQVTAERDAAAEAVKALEKTRLDAEKKQKELYADRGSASTTSSARSSRASSRSSATCRSSTWRTRR